MIAHLRGTIIGKDTQTAIVDVNGVGYEVFAPSSVLDAWTLEEDVAVFICTVVREDAFQLFGFSSLKQKETFEILKTVNKIGAKLALMVLSSMSIDELAGAIQRNDAKMLSGIPGIGKKTAERMCLELKDKIHSEINIPHTGTIPTKSTHNKKEDPLQLALAQLDYRKSEIDVVLNSDTIPSMEEATLSERLSAALKFLAKQG